jgi:hypothetical protein
MPVALSAAVMHFDDRATRASIASHGDEHAPDDHEGNQLDIVWTAVTGRHDVFVDLF